MPPKLSPNFLVDPCKKSHEHKLTHGRRTALTVSLAGHSNRIRRLAVSEVKWAFTASKNEPQALHSSRCLWLVSLGTYRYCRWVCSGLVRVFPEAVLGQKTDSLVAGKLPVLSAELASIGISCRSRGEWKRSRSTWKALSETRHKWHQRDTWIPSRRGRCESGRDAPEFWL